MVQQNEMQGRLERELVETRGEIERMSQEVMALTRDVDDEGGAPRNHMGDEGSSDYERERLMSLQAELNVRVQLMEEAQQRIADGTYGACQRCGQPIPDERLEVMPFAAFDIECQEIVEREDDGVESKASEPLTIDTPAPS